jgi:hypothetical protein
MNDDESEGTSSGKRSSITCSLSREERELICKLRGGWLELGWKSGDFELLLRTSGLHVPSRTLRHWTQCSQDPVPSCSSPVEMGRPRLLDQERASIVLGYCLSRIRSNAVVNLQHVVDFVHASFDIQMTSSTALNYLREFNLSSRVAQVKSQAKLLESDELSKVYSDWIREQRKADMIPSDLSLLGSIDFTYTKHTTTRVRTYTVKGRLVFIFTYKKSGMLTFLNFHLPTQ